MEKDWKLIRDELNKDWRLVSNELPEFNKSVRFKLETDGVLVWESNGWLLDCHIYSIKKTDGLTFKNGTPSHWRFID